MRGIPFTITMLALVAGSSPSLQAADVYVVDDEFLPGVDFVGIEDAVQIAPEGSVLLVKEGHYGMAYIDAKSLSIVAERGADVQLDAVLLANIDADRHVDLQGLRVGTGFGAQALYAVHSEGPIWIDDCEFRGTPAPSALPVWNAVFIADCSAVSMHRSSIRGATFPIAHNPAGVALTLTEARVALFDCEIRGGDAGPAPSGGPAPGVMISGGNLYVSGGSIDGGKGENGFVFGAPCEDGGSGADGLIVAAGVPRIVLLDVRVSGGPGGDTAQPCQVGLDGEDVQLGQLDPGNLTVPQLASHSMSAAVPLRGGESLDLRFEGGAGDLVVLAYSPLHDPTPFPFLAPGLLPFLGGPLLPDLETLGAVTIGTIPLTGPLLSSIPTAPLSVDSIRLYTQELFLRPSAFGEIVLGPGQLVTILGPGF